jgi:hypothetical protein
MTNVKIIRNKSEIYKEERKNVQEQGREEEDEGAANE